MKVNLIGISAKAGSGKDTVAKNKIDDGWIRYAFADPLKKFCMEYLGLTYNDVYTEEGKSRFNSEWGMTNREILQKTGTDALRDKFHEQIWIKIAFRKINELLNKHKGVIITDVRFDNEAELIINIGGKVIQIIRENHNSVLSDKEKKHMSEQGIDSKYISHTIYNDSTVENLMKKLNSII